MRTPNLEMRQITRFYLFSQAHDTLFQMAQELSLPEGLKFQCSLVLQRIWQSITSPEKVAQTVLAVIYCVSRQTRYQIPMRELKRVLQKRQPSRKTRHILTTAGQLGILLGIKTTAASAEEYTNYLLKKLKESKQLYSRLHPAKIRVDDYIEWLLSYTSQILEFLTPNRKKGKNPLILAGAVIAGADVLIGLYRNKKRGFITQGTIAKATDLSEQTLREVYVEVIKPILKSDKFQAVFTQRR